MSFPSTGVIDDFNRADSATLGASYTARPLNDIASASLDIVSNAATSGATFESNWRNTGTYGPDTEVTSTVKASFTNTSDGEGGWLVTSGMLLLRLASPGTASVDGYSLTYEGGPDMGYVATFFRIDNGVITGLGATAFATGGILAGDVFGLEAAGPTLKAYRKPSAGAWGQLNTSRTDSTYTAAGYIGLWGQSWDPTASQFDDLGGGTITAAVSTDVMLPMGMLGTSRV